MLLYNVTITLELDIQEDWLRWMRETHIPDVMATNMFVSYRMSKLLGHEHEDSAIYTIQYLVKDMATLKKYMSELAPALQEDHQKRYKDKYAAFRTVMELVDTNE